MSSLLPNCESADSSSVRDPVLVRLLVSPARLTMKINEAIRFPLKGKHFEALALMYKGAQLYEPSGTDSLEHFHVQIAC